MRDGIRRSTEGARESRCPRHLLSEGMVVKRAVIVLLSCCVGLLWFGAGCSGEKDRERAMNLDLLPADGEIPGWSRSGEPETFIGNTLSEYINGGSELYFAFNFDRVFVQRYSNTSQAAITVELYRMDRPENAYGVYSFDTIGEHPDIGQGATYGYGLLQFWKGRFFVRVLSLSEGVDLRDDVLRFGRRVAGKIKSDGPQPGILSRIEHIEIVPDSLHYFHKNVALNNLYYISNANILNLSEKTEAITFELDHGGRIVRLILIEYPDSAGTQDAYTSFARSYFHDALDKYPDLTLTTQIIEKVENDEFSGLRRSGAFLVLVFETGSKEECGSVLNLVCEGLS